ncbi:hypothetical protein Tco_0932519 [Tanacetum coccineum]
MAAFSEDGLSVIATKLDTPFMLDSYTSNMCMQSWGMSSYDGAMIELRADVELKDTIVCPKKSVSDVVKNLNPRQAARARLSRQEVSNSNLFDALNSIANDDDLGRNEENSKSARKGSLTVAPGSSSYDSAMEEMFNKTVGFMTSTSLKSDNESGYGTKSLLEQWRETKIDNDYDPYDDDLYDGYDRFDDLQVVYDDLDIKVSG